MKVRIIYRNYKPLHAIYQSLVSDPPKDVEYLVSKPIDRLGRFYNMTKWYRYIPGGAMAIGLVEKFIFSKNSDDDADVYHFVNMINVRQMTKPYVVDIEHAASLISFTSNLKKIKEVKVFLTNPNCKSINCLSKAANRTLVELMAEDYKKIEKKVNLLYPALSKPSGLRESNKFINKSSSLKLLFVGNQAYLKGLEELLLSIKKLNKKYKDKIELHVISSDGKEIVDKYNLSNVKLYKPAFSKQEILSEFFIPSDVFIMPTKEDTFGMAVLDALVTGTPAIVTNQFALPEIVTDKKDGFLIKLDNALLDNVLAPTREQMKSINRSNINHKTIEEICRVITEILEGKVKINSFGNFGKQKFEDNGPFAIYSRNKKLEKIYKSALS